MVSVILQAIQFCFIPCVHTTTEITTSHSVLTFSAENADCLYSPRYLAKPPQRTLFPLFLVKSIFTLIAPTSFSQQPSYRITCKMPYKIWKSNSIYPIEPRIMRRLILIEIYFAILSDYILGDTNRDIVQKHNRERSVVYYIIDKAKVRANRDSRALLDIYNV